MRPLRLVVASLTAGILLVSGRAESQNKGPAPPQGPAQSSSQFTLQRGDPGGPDAVQARERARSGDCAGALSGFDAAIQKTIEPTLRRDRGLCHEKLGNRQAAIEDYRAYLTARPEASDAEQIQQRLSALEGQPPPAPPSPSKPGKDPSENGESREAKPEPSKPSKPAAKTKSESSDDEPAASEGFRFGLRTGYMIALGQSIEDRSLNDIVTGGVPLWLDLGYRFAGGNFYVGAYGNFAFVFLKDESNSCGQSGVSCSANQIRFGLMGAYHVTPQGPIDPWFGLGFGYEILSVAASVSTPTGPRSESAAISGFELANIQLGVDFLATPHFRVGPNLGLSLGQYFRVSSDNNNNNSDDIKNKAIHEWLLLGLRGAYDL